MSVISVILLLPLLITCKQFDSYFSKESQKSGLFKYSVFFSNSDIVEESLNKKNVADLQVHYEVHKDRIDVWGNVSSYVNISISENEKVYSLLHGYELKEKNQSYNILTLPLFLRERVRERQEAMQAMHELFTQIDNQLRYLRLVGKKVYPDFSELPMVKDNYTVSGISTGAQVKFAGKLFSKEAREVVVELDSRRASLSEYITYDPSNLTNPPKNTEDTSADKIYKKAAIIHQKIMQRKRPQQSFFPRFKKIGTASSPHIDFFYKVMQEVLLLRQAQLLLARSLLKLYEWLYLPYDFNVMGNKQELLLLVSVDDVRRAKSPIGHVIVARSIETGKFPFGSIRYDHRLRVASITHSLKPIGKGRIYLLASR